MVLECIVEHGGFSAFKMAKFDISRIVTVSTKIY
jgi:hypothetical protein